MNAVVVFDAAAVEINNEYFLARTSACDAVKHAVRCGQMLEARKNELPRGKFDRWLKEHCQCSRATAYNWIKLSKSSNPLDAVRHLFPSGRPAARSSEAVPFKPKEVMDSPPPPLSHRPDASMIDIFRRLGAGQLNLTHEEIDAIREWLDELSESIL
jgi:hypothetical protein